MGSRYWLWLAGRLLAAGVIVLWAASFLRTGSGEKEFQKTLDAMKQVHSFRAAYLANPSGQRAETLWEVDCDRGLLHYQSLSAEIGGNPPQGWNQDELHVAEWVYQRQADGTWSHTKYTAGNRSAKWYCVRLEQGTDSYLLPEIATMIKRGIIEEGDKKTVNGVRCREWRVTMKNRSINLEHDTVCIGLEDHLPYEMSTEGNLTHYSFSDYNTSIQFDVPEGPPQAEMRQ